MAATAQPNGRSRQIYGASREFIAYHASVREHRGQHARNHGTKERGVKIEFIRKTDSSTTGNCPAIYRAENGNYVVQGWRIDEETRAQLRDLADHETAVEIPADVIAGVVEAH